MADNTKLTKAASRINDLVFSLPEREFACQGAIPQAQPGQAGLEFLAFLGLGLHFTFDWHPDVKG